MEDETIFCFCEKYRVIPLLPTTSQQTAFPKQSSQPETSLIVFHQLRAVPIHAEERVNLAILGIGIVDPSVEK